MAEGWVTLKLQGTGTSLLLYLVYSILLPKQIIKHKESKIRTKDSEEHKDTHVHAKIIIW